MEQAEKYTKVCLGESERLMKEPTGLELRGGARVCCIEVLFPRMCRHWSVFAGRFSRTVYKTEMIESLVSLLLGAWLH